MSKKRQHRRDCGDLAGAAYGMEAISERWAGHLELRDEILTLADDLLTLRSGTDRIRL